MYIKEMLAIWPISNLISESPAYSSLRVENVAIPSSAMSNRMPVIIRTLFRGNLSTNGDIKTAQTDLEIDINADAI